MKTRIASLLLSALALFGAPATNAAVIFSTYGGNASGTTSTGIRTNNGKAMSFAMPNPLQPGGTTSYTLDSVELLLSGNSASSVIQLSLYTNDGSNTPGTLITSFTPASSFTLTSTATLYTFNPGSSITLDANTTYWVTLSSTNGTGNTTGVNWNTSSPLPSPLSSVGVGFGTNPAIFGTNTTPSSWTSTSSVNNAFIVNATAVPEPAGWGLAIIGTTVFLRRNFRRKL